MGRSPNADRLTSAEHPMVYAVRSAVVNPREDQASTGVFSCADKGPSLLMKSPWA